MTSLTFASTGEQTVQEILDKERSGKKAGQLIRLIDVRVEGRPYGLFECLHGMDNADQFATALKNACRSSFGQAGLHFIEALCNADNEKLLAQYRLFQENFLRLAGQTMASPQLKWIANSFGLCAFACELAVNFKILPWEKGHGMEQILKIFKDWESSRVDNTKFLAFDVIEQVRDYIRTNQESIIGAKNFLAISKHGDPIGTFVSGSHELFLRARYFSKGALKGFDFQKACQILIEEKMLIPHNGKKSFSRRIDGCGVCEVYHLKNIDRFRGES